MKKINENNNSREDTMEMYFLARDMVNDCVTEFWVKMYEYLEDSECNAWCVSEITNLLIVMCDKDLYEESLSVLFVLFNLLSIDSIDLRDLFSDKELRKMFTQLFTHNLAEIEYYTDDEQRSDYGL